MPSANPVRNGPASGLYCCAREEHRIARTGQLRVGTSGYSYAEWKGTFYPEKMPARDMLAFYAARFATVEINHTFYRMPAAKALAEWAAVVPEGFQFALKANRNITHIRRLRDCEESVERFLEAAKALAETGRLGPVLVQLPPNFAADLPRLGAFLKLLPADRRFALEVRHASWHAPETYELLREFGAALCIAETDEESAPETLTAEFTYLRLRKTTYTRAELKTWREKCRAWMRQGTDVYVYFKHEDSGTAPAYARLLLEESAD